MKIKPWLIYASITTVTWGVWGALIEKPEKAGFPNTLGYIVWAILMMPNAIIALSLIKGKLDGTPKTIGLAFLSGLIGCGSLVLLFYTVLIGPPYLVFPIIALSPIFTIILAKFFLKEHASKRSWVGISIAIIAILALSYQPPGDNAVEGYLWLVLSVLISVAWGLQAFILKFVNNRMKVESVVFYSVLPALVYIPVVIAMTDFNQPINWGYDGFYLTAFIQVLNTIGYFTFVYAFKHGKAIIVSPMVNALAPVVTVVLSLIIYWIIPHPIIITGIILASIAAFLMAIEPEEDVG
jgi:drug/metabolite transporter (DMT)-like permease